MICRGHLEKCAAIKVCTREISKAELLQLKLIHLFASELLLMKKLEIKKTKPTLLYQF